jgi:hypothetical protein
MKDQDYNDFEKWQADWDAALKTDAFKDQKPANPSAATGFTDFFGVSSSKNSNTKEPDAEYWNNLYGLSNEYAPDANNIEDDSNDVDDDHLEGDLMQEEVHVEPKTMAKAMAQSPNPIRPSSIGMDQDVKNPISLGATYDVADLQSLETLKVKLHGLLDKLNGIEGLAGTGAKLESQIASLQKQIDEISDGLAHGVPSNQGD